ncbi:MAG: radical SAM protein [Chloroflexi bacterium]|nr:radical SAM protein [Chloroflexota bacterium]
MDTTQTMGALDDGAGVRLAPEAVRQSRPEIVSWNVTQRCNLRCSHCYLDAGQRAPAELSTQESFRLIDQLVLAGTQMLILSGGEPLLRHDLVPLAAYAASRGLLVVLGTNGTALTPSNIGQLRAAGVAGAGISLDSTCAAQHDRFRGVPGAWEGAIRGLRACVAQELPVLLQMTVLPWNYQEVAGMVALASREGATGFTLYFLVCTGRGEQLSDITPQQYEEALAVLVEAQPRYPQMMVRARCTPQISRVAAVRGSSLVGNAGCLAARQYCRITPEGDVTPCPYLPLVAGSVREQPFESIWQRAPLLQRLRQEAPAGRCGRCDFQESCGGCRARAFALAGDLAGEDPWCTYQPPGQRPEQGAGQTPAARAPRPVWAAEADQRLQRIPPFIRARVKVAVEQQAAAKGEAEITGAVMTAALESLGRRIPFPRPRATSATAGAGSPGSGEPAPELTAARQP